jgi:hypothetical protein
MADFLGQRYGVIAEVQHQRFSAASQRDGPPLQLMERRGILPPVHFRTRVLASLLLRRRCRLIPALIAYLIR